MSKTHYRSNKSESATQSPMSESTVSPRSRAHVFISHDSRDADLAEAFGNLLMDASGGMLKSFRSSDRKGSAGIEFGAEWYSTIMTKLQDATDVVALLTQHSVNRPWILYEAGVAKGKLNTTVFGVAVGIPLEQAGAGPFAQFQNCGQDEDSLTKLVLQLIRRNPDAAPREEAVKLQVQAFVASLAKVMKTRGKQVTLPEQDRVDETMVAKLFEEVKVMFAALPETLEAKLHQSARHKSGLVRRKLHPMLMEELLFHPEARDSSTGLAARWLLLVSVLRNELPWLYEAGIDLYRAMCSGVADEIAAAHERLTTVAELAACNRGIRHVFGEDEDNRMMIRHLPNMIRESLGGLPKRRGVPMPKDKTPDAIPPG